MVLLPIPDDIQFDDYHQNRLECKTFDDYLFVHPLKRRVLHQRTSLTKLLTLLLRWTILESNTLDPTTSTRVSGHLTTFCGPPP